MFYVVLLGKGEWKRKRLAYKSSNDAFENIRNCRRRRELTMKDSFVVIFLLRYLEITFEVESFSALNLIH